MTTLGEILGRLCDRSEVYRLLAEAGDTALISRLNRMANEAKEDPCEIALRAVQVFAEKADGEAWTRLVGCVQNSSSPAGACLREMIAWSMKHALGQDVTAPMAG
jgi:ABC-type phosphate transport system ATPase subunit